MLKRKKSGSQEEVAEVLRHSLLFPPPLVLSSSRIEFNLVFTPFSVLINPILYVNWLFEPTAVDRRDVDPRLEKSPDC